MVLSQTGGTLTTIKNVALDSEKDRLDGFAIALFKVRDKVIPFSVLFIRDYMGKFNNSEFLVCRGFGIIISPLFKRNIFTDK